MQCNSQSPAFIHTSSSFAQNLLFSLVLLDSTIQLALKCADRHAAIQKSKPSSHSVFELHARKSQKNAIRPLSNRKHAISARCNRIMLHTPYILTRALHETEKCMPSSPCIQRPADRSMCMCNDTFRLRPVPETAEVLKSGQPNENPRELRPGHSQQQAYPVWVAPPPLL